MKAHLFLILSLGCFGCDYESAASSTVQDDGEQKADDYRPRVVLKTPMRAIVDPKIVDAKEASEKLNEAQLVLGVSINGESRAYPISMLCGPSREIINDELGGKSIAATW